MAKAVEPLALYVVQDSFVVEIDGEPVAYRKGELVHPDDPILKRSPAAFKPFEFPHPVKRQASPRVEAATAAPGEKRGA